MHDMPIKPLPPVMTTEEVGAVLRCSVATVRRYVHAHQLMAVQIGRQRRFRAEDVLEFIAARPSTTGSARNRRKPAFSSVSPRQ